MEVNGCVKRLEVFLVVCFCIKFKYLYHQLWHILNSKLKTYTLLNRKLFRIRIFKFDENFVLYSFKFIKAECFIHIHNPNFTFIYQHFLLNFLQIIFSEIFGILTKWMNWALRTRVCDVFQVLRNNIFFNIIRIPPSPRKIRLCVQLNLIQTRIPKQILLFFLFLFDIVFE